MKFPVSLLILTCIISTHVFPAGTYSSQKYPTKTQTNERHQRRSFV